MKLYEIPRGSKIVCEAQDGSTYIIFHRIDGAYSTCTSEKGNPCYLGASTELTQEGEHYLLTESL